MATIPLSNCADVRVSSFGIAMGFALVLGACGEKDQESADPTDASTNSPIVTVSSGDGSVNPPAGTDDNTSGQPAGSGTGGSQTNGGTTGTTPNDRPPQPGHSGAGAAGPDDPSGSGGAPPDDGNSGGDDGTGGVDAVGSASGDTTVEGTAGAGGAPPGGAGAANSEGGEAGASTDGGASGSAEGGTGGSDGNPASTECTRSLLDGLLDDYFSALSAGDPSSLPLAANVKFTENAEQTEIGMTDFWMNAGDLVYSQRALDTTACSAAVQAVVPEGATDRVIAVRIKVELGELTEVETIVFREGDYTASYSVPSNPQAIVDVADSIGWHDEIPEADRSSRDELAGWIDKYFRAFPNGVCNVADSCRRLENGGGDFDCDGFSGCSDGNGSGAIIPRLILVDEVRGIAAGLANFDYMADGHLDMHMIKMSPAGEVLAVHAILRDTDGQSGWD